MYAIMDIYIVTLFPLQYSSEIVYIMQVSVLCFICVEKKYIYTLTGHFIRYTCSIGW